MRRAHVDDVARTNDHLDFTNKWIKNGKPTHRPVPVCVRDECRCELFLVWNLFGKLMYMTFVRSFFSWIDLRQAKQTMRTRSRNRAQWQKWPKKINSDTHSRLTPSDKRAVCAHTHSQYPKYVPTRHRNEAIISKKKKMKNLKWYLLNCIFAAANRNEIAVCIWLCTSAQYGIAAIDAMSSRVGTWNIEMACVTERNGMQAIFIAKNLIENHVNSVIKRKSEFKSNGIDGRFFHPKFRKSSKKRSKVGADGFSVGLSRHGVV